MSNIEDILFPVGFALLLIIGGAVSGGAIALLLSALFTIVYGTSDLIRLIPFGGVVAGAVLGPAYGFLELR